MSVYDGKISNSSDFTLFNKQLCVESFIPSIQQNLVKVLGHINDGFLSDSKRSEELITKLKEGVSIIDRSFHLGKNKAWILQYLPMPKIE